MKFVSFDIGASSITIRKMMNIVIKKVATTASISYDDSVLSQLCKTVMVCCL